MWERQHGGTQQGATLLVVHLSTLSEEVPKQILGQEKVMAEQTDLNV